MTNLEQNHQNREDFNRDYINMRSRYLEAGESVLYVDYDTESDRLILGTACNSGLIEHFSIEIDYDFTLDENIEYLIDEAREEGIL